MDWLRRLPQTLSTRRSPVPVNPDTLDTWIYPPYSGFYDAETGLIWGRGTSDDKASLTGIMLTLETLIGKGWTPKRTVVLAFGFDEESSGIHGAKTLGKALEEIYASAYSSSESKGHIELSQAFNHELEPAPRTPTSGKGSEPWDFLSGTIKATYAAHTDTKYYWNLTRHIFRYNHKNGAYGGEIATGVHTVNENIPLDHYLEMIRFFSTLILNADEAKSFE
ncbi:carboxypeptidase S [Lentinula edodes]|uniref:Carboxypeptidase S n=1 Tax=Lentinula edodes TaxID=5353 RepID=A0A1Q3E1L4_LENED|nr:carboxypeptidase S [Lentinula edodes]